MDDKSEANTQTFSPEHFVRWLHDVAFWAQHPDRPEPAARATLAILRRGLGKAAGAPPEVERIILRRLRNPESPLERLAYLIGPLFALHEQGGHIAREDHPRSLGDSLALLWRRRGEDAGEQAGNRIDPVERRVLQLLGSRPRDLPHHLRRIVLLLKADQVPINWTRLWWDVYEWGDPKRTVQHRWAKDLWSPVRVAPAGSPAHLDQVDMIAGLDIGEEGTGVEDDE